VVKIEISGRAILWQKESGTARLKKIIDNIKKIKTTLR
jgi:hypothetical protein